MSELAASYRLCRQVARSTASNFYYSFLLLPRAKRLAMCALYAFLRRTDDLGDSQQSLPIRRAALAAWRRSLERALTGQFDDLLLPAVADTLARFDIPADYLREAITGVEMDLDIDRYETFDDLKLYCHRVASVVGMACIHIWGFRDPRAIGAACQCGLAFQLTNILRDLKEDAACGRFYLPEAELRRFDYTRQDLRQGVRDDRFRALIRFQIERAERLYDAGAELSQWLEPDGQKVFAAMLDTYRSLLGEIKRRDGDVFTHRVRLSRWRKIGIAARTLWFGPPQAAAAALRAAPR
jgi:phytoene synthase